MGDKENNGIFEDLFQKRRRDRGRWHDVRILEWFRLQSVMSMKISVQRERNGTNGRVKQFKVKGEIDDLCPWCY